MENSYSYSKYVRYMDIYFYVDHLTSKKDSNVPKEGWIVSRLGQLRALIGGWIPSQRKNNRQRGKLITSHFNMTYVINRNTQTSVK